MKRYSTSYVIREMKVKTMRLPLHTYEKTKSETLTIPNARKDVEQQELSFIACGNAKWHSHLGRQPVTFLQNRTYSYHVIHPSITLLGIYPKEWKTMSTQKPAHRFL